RGARRDWNADTCWRSAWSTPPGGGGHAAGPDGQACGDADVCNGIETCQHGACTAGTALNCDDGDACTTDLPCDPSTGCHYQPIAGCCTTNADCADTSLCTTNERCVSGACTSDAVNCDDANACTNES